MYRRSRAREVALQLLFQRDLNPAMDRAAVETFVANRMLEATGREVCLKLFDDVTARSEEIDAKLTAAADNWRLARMSAVDRNVLRLGALELLASDPMTPPAIVIDEAIELARRFGTADSPAFVNGVLDRVNRNLNPPAE